MNKNLFFFSLLLAATILAACAPQHEPTTLQEELAALGIPPTYVVTQEGSDTGFAGANGTGAYHETITFAVEDERVNATEKHMTLLTMSDIEQRLQAQQMTSKNDTTRCYEHEQWGVERITACFDENVVISYDELRTLGNHQTQTIRWELQGRVPSLASGRATHK